MDEKHMVLRGARVLQQLADQEQKKSQIDEVSTVPDLDQNIRTAFPHTKKRQHVVHEVTIANVEYIPYIGMKMLHVRSTSMSNSHAYSQSMQFLRVEFENAESDTAATFQASDGSDYHIVPVDLTNHNVKVRCNCLDFHFRFANYNSSDKSLVGRPPPPYQRKTQNRPSVNPDQVPGMCKHLLKLVETLQANGVINPST
jgi:hypothetical protein